MTDAAGLAVAPRLTAGRVAGAFTVTAAYADLPAQTVFNLSVRPGAPAVVKLLSGGKQTARLYRYFSLPIVLQVLDAYGNAITGAKVTFQVPSRGPGAVFSSAPLTDARGVTTVKARTDRTLGGPYRVVARTGSASVAFTLTNR
jgi:hypothetical protein